MVLNEEKSAKILQKCKNMLDSVINNPAYTEWFNTALRCEMYYSGNPWGDIPSSDLNLIEISKNLKIDLIKGYVHSLIGEQLKTKTSISVCARDSYLEDDKEIEETVNAVNSTLYRTYESNKVLYQQNQSMKDMLVFGLGAGLFDRNADGIEYKRINPLYLFPDLRDETLGFEDSEFIGCLMPMTINKALRLFPSLKEEISEKIESKTYTPQSAISFIRSNRASVHDGNFVFVKMFEWKTYEKSYSGMTERNRRFCVFDYDFAKKIAFDKKTIETSLSPRIHRAYFAGDRLLHYRKKQTNIPDQGFSLVCSSLLKKISSNGFFIPQSFVEGLLDLQREFVIRQSKSLFLSDAKKLVIDPDAIEARNTTPEDLKRELKSATSVIFARNPNVSVRDISLEKDIRTSIGLAEEYQRLFDYVSGIHREQRGEQSNASSGIGIYRRQIQSITSSIYAFNEFDNFKKRVGRLFVNYYQDLWLGKINILAPSHQLKNLKTILNNSKENKNFVDFLNLDVYVEESPDFLSTKEEQRELLSSLLQSPMAGIFLQSKKLMQSLGIKLSEEVFEELQQVLTQQKGQENVGTPTPV